MNELLSRATPEMRSFKPSGKDNSLLRRGDYGTLGMLYRRTKDPADVMGGIVETVAREGAAPAYEIGRDIVEKKVASGMTVGRDEIFQAANQAVDVARTYNFLNLYENEEGEAIISMPPADARVIRKALEVRDQREEEQEDFEEPTMQAENPPTPPTLTEVIFQKSELPPFHPEDSTVNNQRRGQSYTSEPITVHDPDIAQALDMH